MALACVDTTFLVMAGSSLVLALVFMTVVKPKTSYISSVSEAATRTQALAPARGQSAHLSRAFGRVYRVRGYFSQSSQVTRPVLLRILSRRTTTLAIEWTPPAVALQGWPLLSHAYLTETKKGLSMRVLYPMHS